METKRIFLTIIEILITFILMVVGYLFFYLLFFMSDLFYPLAYYDMAVINCISYISNIFWLITIIILIALFISIIIKKFKPDNIGIKKTVSILTKTILILISMVVGYCLASLIININNLDVNHKLPMPTEINTGVAFAIIFALISLFTFRFKKWGIVVYILIISISLIFIISYIPWNEPLFLPKLI